VRIAQRGKAAGQSSLINSIVRHSSNYKEIERGSQGGVGLVR
jgi:hypothetical protein